MYSGRLALRAAAGVEGGGASPLLPPSPAFYLKATATPDKFGETYLWDPPVTTGPHEFPVPTPESSFSNPYFIYLQVSYCSGSFLLPTPREKLEERSLLLQCA